MQQKIYVQKIPIATPTYSNLPIRSQIANYARQINELKNRKLEGSFERSQIVSHVNAINQQIDILVYELYGLNKEESKLVSGIN